MSNTKRYSDEDLAVFKEKIDKKLKNTRQDLAFLQKQIEELSESSGDVGDRMDDTSNANDLTMLYNMASRQIKHIRDLENALTRIHNKNYGICVVTGELIDKKRLLAVPATTKSLAAKQILQAQKEQPSEQRPLHRAVVPLYPTPDPLESPLHTLGLP